MCFITATSSSVILRGKRLLKPTDFDIPPASGRFDVHASATACKAKYVVSIFFAAETQIKLAAY